MEALHYLVYLLYNYIDLSYDYRITVKILEKGDKI